MDTGHITQLAREQLGKQSRCVYRQDFTRPKDQGRLKIDDLGAGDVQEVDDKGAVVEQYDYTPDGLRLAVTRPSGATGNQGVAAAVSTTGVDLEDRFLLVANFERPTLPPVADYTFAPLILIKTDKLAGVSCQFAKTGVYLNLPRVAPRPAGTPKRLDDQDLAARIFDPRHPSPFTVALALERKDAAAEGRAFLFVGNTGAASIPSSDSTFECENWKLGKEITLIRAGLSTTDPGSGYTASVTLLDFEIWAPGPRNG